MDAIKYIEDTVIEKFIKSAKKLNDFDPSIDIDYGKYISIYNSASKTLLPLMAKLNFEKFIFLNKEFPNLVFDFEGRLKSEYSFFDKIIKQAIMQSAPINSEDSIPFALYDIFAFRIILKSVSYDIDTAICQYNEKRRKYEYKFTTNELDEDDKKSIYKINADDTIKLSDGTCVTVTSNNITLMNNTVYIISENGSYIPLNGAKIIKQDRSTLTKMLYTVKDKLSSYYEENSFEHVSFRDRDYVKNPKSLKYAVKNSNNETITDLKNKLSSESTLSVIHRLKNHSKNMTSKDNINMTLGKPLPCYQSLQQTYYYSPYDTYFEDQIRTIYMHNVAEYSKFFGHDVYKSNRLDENSLSKLPTFITYSKDMVNGNPEYSYKINDMEYSVEKSFGISLEEFIEKMHELNKSHRDTINNINQEEHNEGPEI